MASSGISHRSTSPARFNTCTSSSRFSVSDQSVVRSLKKKTCMCSPTTHPGSFRCSIHKRVNNKSVGGVGVGVGGGSSSSACFSNRMYARRSAMANSLVRIGTVEGYLVKRAFAALIRPSSHQQRRQSGFKPRPTRLSVMSTANEDAS